jgi:hypothetical protein
MGGEAVLERVDGHGVHCEFMSGSKDANCDFLGMKSWMRLRVDQQGIHRGWQRGSWGEGRCGQRPSVSWTEWSGQGCPVRWGRRKSSPSGGDGGWSWLWIGRCLTAARTAPVICLVFIRRGLSLLTPLKVRVICMEYVQQVTGISCGYRIRICSLRETHWAEYYRVN